MYKQFKKRNRRKDIISADVVEETRVKLGLKKGEFAELMGIRGNQYLVCMNKGGFLSFRYYAALDAIENKLMRKVVDDMAQVHKLKTGLSLDESDAN